MHALAAVERDRARPAEALALLDAALVLHQEDESLHGEAWTHFQLGQTLLRTGDVERAEDALLVARDLYGRTRDERGGAWALTQLARARLLAGDAAPAAEQLNRAVALHRDNEDARGEAWTCLEPALIDAGNNRAPQTLELCGEATELFESYGDARGADWARFLRCTLLPYASPGGSEADTAVAQQEPADLLGVDHPTRDGGLEDCAEAFAVMLNRGVDLEDGRQAWRPGMTPARQAREIMGVPLPPRP